MTTKTKYRTPIWFWFIALPEFILGVMGILQIQSVWGVEMTEPLWAKLSYSLGIVGAFLGGIALVLRQKISVYFYLLSILGLVLHRIWVFGLSDRAADAPWTLFLPIMINIAVISVILYGLKKGWIRTLRRTPES